MNGITKIEMSELAWTDQTNGSAVAYEITREGNENDRTLIVGAPSVTHALHASMAADRTGRKYYTPTIDSDYRGPGRRYEMRKYRATKDPKSGPALVHLIVRRFAIQDATTSSFGYSRTGSARVSVHTAMKTVEDIAFNHEMLAN